MFKNMENIDFERMLDQCIENDGIYPGKIVKATVIIKGKDEVYVDFGYMKEGAIAYSEWAAGDHEEVAKTINVGDEVEAKVLHSTYRDDFVRLSKIRADQDKAWKNVPELAEGEKRTATVKVLRVIKNRQKNIVGLAVAVEGVEGFMPASHVELRHVEDFTPYIGQELEAEIIEVDTAKKRLVVSRRDLLRAERKAKARAWHENKPARVADAIVRKAKEEAQNNVEERQILPGKILNITDFGLYIAFGDNAVGFVQKSELSTDTDLEIKDYKIGSEVKVLVQKNDCGYKIISIIK